MITAIDVHKPGAKIGNCVVIVGGNTGGCETALYLQPLNKEITIVEMTSRLCTDATREVSMSIDLHLGEGIRRLTNARCTAISESGVEVTYKDGKIENISADTVILAVGMRANDDVYQSLFNSDLDVVPVGDCVKPATIFETSRTAYYAALDL